MCHGPQSKRRCDACNEQYLALVYSVYSGFYTRIRGRAE